MNQWTSQNPFTQLVLILTLFSPPSFVRKSKEEVNVEKGKSYFGGAGGILMNFSVMYYIFLHTHEHVGKMQKKEKKAKHRYIADSHIITYWQKRKKETHPSTFFSTYMKKINKN